MADFLINGRAGNDLPLTDRAIHYGDGVFETIAVVDGATLCWDRHLRRLGRGCERLGIPVPDAAQLAGEARRLAAGRDRAVLKILVSRGSGGRGYQPPADPEPTRILAVHPWPDYPDTLYRQGLACTLSRIRLGHVPLLAGIKHLNRLEQVLARNEVTRRGYREGLLRDLNDCIIEGTMSNLFLVRGGELVTPDLAQCGVAGIVREVLLERAGERGLNARVMPVSLADVEAAEEVFLCNSILGVCPVTRLDDSTWPAGTVTAGLRRDLIDARIIAGS